MTDDGDDVSGGVVDDAIGAAGAIGGGDDDNGGSGGGGGGGGGDDADWLEKFSAEGGDADNPSNRDWLKAKGFKTPDDLAKSYREAEKAIHAKGDLKIPGEAAKPDEIAAYHKAIGVPEKAEDYQVTLPDGVKEDELDLELLGSLKEDALKGGMPAKAFDGLASAFIQKQLDAIKAEATSENEDRDGLLKEWGAQKDAKLADVQNAMRALDLKRADVTAMQRGFRLQYGEPGSRRTLELLQKLGAGTAEDTLLHGDGPRRFGISGEEAQAEINRLTGDKEFGKKLLAKEPEATARWDRLNAAVAAEEERKKRAAAAQ